MLPHAFGFSIGQFPVIVYETALVVNDSALDWLFLRAVTHKLRRPSRGGAQTDHSKIPLFGDCTNRICCEAFRFFDIMISTARKLRRITNALIVSIYIKYTTVTYRNVAVHQK